MAHHSSFARWWRRHFAYPTQALLSLALLKIIAALPPDAASAFGGAMLRSIGPALGASKKARRNLDRALPELSDDQKRHILRGMWDNLGRVLAEYPHLNSLWNTENGRVTLIGAEHLEKCATSGQPFLMFSAHLANWELLPTGAGRLGVSLTSVYRRPNNPIINRLILKIRPIGAGKLVPKGRDGAKAVLSALLKGGAVAMLIDQKMNDGVPVPFFGQDAMTAPAAAQLALKLRCPLLPARVERLEGAKFRVTVEPPLTLPNSGNRETDVLTLLTCMNQMIRPWFATIQNNGCGLHNAGRMDRGRKKTKR
ncbi:Kdo2-lipid IVA lauroyltransferase/acyltransferase [Azospirillaceae bacterium]